MLKVLFLLNLVFIHLALADVYPDTINQRRELTAAEQQHLLHLGMVGQPGCSASALTPDTIITAEHCIELGVDGFDLSLTKGYFEFDTTQTFTVITQKKIVKPVDVSSHYANDVMILKIKWTNGAAPTSLRYPHELVNSESQLKFGIDSDASRLFALGYPHDLDRRATYSYGYLKDKDLKKRSAGKVDPYTHDQTLESLYLKVNIPLTHGNSGGPIYTENFKLVGIVDAGSLTSDLEKESPDYNSQNPLFWNHVGALYFLYPQMKSLQAIFPNGINPDVSDSGEWIGK